MLRFWRKFDEHINLYNRDILVQFVQNLYTNESNMHLCVCTFFISLWLRKPRATNESYRWQWWHHYHYHHCIYNLFWSMNYTHFYLYEITWDHVHNAWITCTFAICMYSINYTCLVCIWSHYIYDLNCGILPADEENAEMHRELSGRNRQIAL